MTTLFLLPMRTGRSGSEGYVNEVVIGCGGEIIARHERSYDEGDMTFNPLHYLPLIERKVASFDQAPPA